VNDGVQSLIGRWHAASDSTQFWWLQLAGWSGLSVISYFSLNLWYNQPHIAYLGHNLSQSALGMLLCWPMRHIFRALWRRPLLLRTVLVALVVLLFASLWAALRLILFQAMTEESGLWPDFGGWLYASIFIFLCWTALYHGIKYYRLAERKHAALMAMAAARNLEAVKAAHAQAAAREAQLEMLRYQLNPHFLFNTLNAVQSLVTSQKTEHATRMIASLSDCLRYSLYSSAQGNVTVAQEFEALERYLEIEQARFGERLRLDIQLQPAASGQMIPCMLLQPLVENAIKYAIAAAESGGNLSIAARCEGGQLCLEVSDSGPGVDDSASLQPGGVGLNNIRSRLQNHYGAAHEFTLAPAAGGGLRALIRVPMQPLAQSA
jgi:sensor histidine kinase YesM